MTRRKRKNEPDETAEALSEDTREMWTVAGDRRVEDEPTEEWEEEDLPESDWQGESGSDEDWVERDESEAGWADEDEWPEDGEPEDEWAEDGQLEGEWADEEEPEPTEGPGAEQRRSLRSRIGSIAWPDIPEPDPRRLLTGVAVVAAALAVGFGTYELGKSGGPDLDTARIRGEASGREAGAIEGAATGYPAGFRKGREKGFARAYRQNYRIYYRRAFEQAGLDVPGEGEIKVPSP